MKQDEFFLTLQKQLDNQLPFVAYRKPNSNPVLGVLQENNTLHIVTTYKETGFVFAPFNNNENAVLLPIDKSRVLTLNVFSEEQFEDSKITNNTVSSQKKHIDLVTKGINAISKKTLEKVVLSRVEEVELQNANPIILFKRLLANYSKALTYIWYHPKVGLWVGATPETLIKTEGNRFKTMALAGTQPYNNTLDVVWQNKEKEEQQLVTNFIVDHLTKCVDRISASPVKTSRAGNVLHLKTEISGVIDFNKNSLKDIVFKLHPTPATCGLPKEKAKQFILENENYEREFYTGFLGEINYKAIQSRNTNRRNVENNAYSSVKTVSDLYVNLRCMQINNNTALIYVGGGITKDSNPESEWQETINKTQTMKKVLF